MSIQQMLLAGGAAGGALDPNYASVGLLLHFDGTNFGTTFTDNSPSPKTPTSTNGTTTSTATVKFGTASGSFNGSSNYLEYADNAAWQLGTGDFTIEFWINASASGTYTMVVGTQQSGVDNGFWRVGNRFNSLNQIYFARGTGTGFNEVQASVNVNDGSWHHVAVVRSSGTVTIYADGISSASSSITGTCSTNQALRVGYNQRDSAYISGNVDDLRITKGVARYTANFTPPTAAFPDS